MNTETDKQDLVITRVFDAPIEQVWQAWIDPAYVMQWWGPDHFTCPLAQLDVRPGGTSLVCMTSPQFGEFYSTWRYQSITPLKEIDYIHNLADKDGQPINPADAGMPPEFVQGQRHVVTMKALGDGKTELTVTEYGWTPGRMMEMSRMGMEQCLGKMAAIFTR